MSGNDGDRQPDAAEHERGEARRGPRHPARAGDVAGADRHAHHRHAGDADGKGDRHQQELQARADAVAGQRLGAEAGDQRRQHQHGQHRLQRREGGKGPDLQDVEEHIAAEADAPEPQRHARLAGLQEPEQEQRAGSEADHQAGGYAGEAEARDRSDAEPQCAAEPDLQRRGRRAASARARACCRCRARSEASVLRSQISTAPASATLA